MIASDALGWMEQGSCRAESVATNVFFPPRHDPSKVRAAKAVCANCPVKVQCLAYGMDERFGIFGGKSERERRRMRSLRHAMGAAA